MSALAPHVQSIDDSVLHEILQAHHRFLARNPGGRRAILGHVDLSACQLDRVNLSEAELTGCIFKDASLNGANLESAVLYGCDLRDADLRGANLARADLRGACLVGANLAGANLAGCDLREGRIALQRGPGHKLPADPPRAGELTYAVLQGADLSGAQMTGAWATAADFTDANLSNAVLVGAKLARAVLDGADLSGADVFHADLGGASLRGAVITGVNVEDANLDEADLTAVLRSPPPLAYVDDRALSDVISEHERFCATNGLEGLPAKLDRVDFRSLRQLRRRKLSGLSARDGVFFGMDLEGVEMQGADLTGADLRGANLKGADLRGVKLVGALMNRANLRQAILDPLVIGEGRSLRADLSRACLRHADLRGVRARKTRFLESDREFIRMDGADLAGAELET